MFKLAIAVVILAMAFFVAAPYVFEKYAVWDALNPHDDVSGMNLIFYALTPEVAIPIVNQSLDLNIGAYVIDVRSKGEYDEGHIKNSLNIPLETLHDEIPKITKNKQAVIYLYDNKGPSGATATRLLRSMGYEKAFYLEGGLDAWIKAGFFAVTPNPAYF